MKRLRFVLLAAGGYRVRPDCLDRAVTKPVALRERRFPAFSCVVPVRRPRAYRRGALTLKESLENMIP